MLAAATLASCGRIGIVADFVAGVTAAQGRGVQWITHLPDGPQEARSPEDRKREPIELPRGVKKWQASLLQLIYRSVEPPRAVHNRPGHCSARAALTGILV